MRSMACQRQSWHDWAHAVLATVVYPLGVKVLLARAAAIS